MTSADLLLMVEGFLEAALFTADESVVPPCSGEFPFFQYKDRISKAMRTKALSLCLTFFNANETLLLLYPARCAGHDLAYTINHHGCGFWEADHCSKEEGDLLTAAAHRFPEFAVYRTRSGWLNME